MHIQYKCGAKDSTRKVSASVTRHKPPESLILVLLVYRQYHLWLYKLVGFFSGLFYPFALIPSSNISTHIACPTFFSLRVLSCPLLCSQPQLLTSPSPRLQPRHNQTLGKVNAAITGLKLICPKVMATGKCEHPGYCWVTKQALKR